MLIVNYDPDNHFVVEDGKIEKCVNELLEMYFKTAIGVYETKITVGSELIVQYFRVAVREGKISHEDIKFEYKGQRIDVDKFGNLREWPKGFCDIVDDYLNRLIEW